MKLTEHYLEVMALRKQTFPPWFVSANSKGKKTLMKLADGLLISYSNSIAAIPEDIWTIVRGTGTDQDIKIAHRRNDGRTNTAMVSVSASFQLPMPLRATFDHLRNNMMRPEVY
jgi:hypothetical protein